jgi:xanthine/CO dehydrogenase XdhC/CoxF family maturation factor
MARLAVEAGLRTTVLDHRPGYARAERFPGVEDVLAVRPDELPPMQSPVAAILMTHNYEVDRQWLAALLGLPLAYLGLLGPRRRTASLLEELGVTAWPAYLHAPLGLDIGAETPEEVALAAMAELKAVLAGRKGGFLRDRGAPIHEAACPSVS